MSAKDEEGQRHPIYVWLKTCRPQPVKVHTCTPICTQVAPSTPTLLSPANNSNVSSNTVSLVWNNLSQNWGTACTQNNQFSVYIGTSPSSMGLLGTVGSGTGSANFTGTEGQTYYWRVMANNGALTAYSPTWQFTINSGPWWQVMDGA
jgi:hypothetical protein